MSESGQGGRTSSSAYDPAHRRTGDVPEQQATTEQGEPAYGDRAYGERAYGEPGYQRPAAEDTRRGATAGGFIALAAILMILSGLWSFFVGITGVLKGAFYVTVPNYTFTYSVHSWGWTHLIIGAVLFAAGVCLFLGMMWARVAGVVLAVISGLANFLFLPYYPIWSFLVIALDVIIIWAIITGGSRRQAL